MIFPVSETTIFMYTFLLLKERISVLISTFGKERPATIQFASYWWELGLETTR